MALITLTETHLRDAMRDPRYWRAGDPEREDYVAWVSEGWAEMAKAGEAPGRVSVRVRAYERRRNGRRHHVEGYTQSRRAAGPVAESFQIAQAGPGPVPVPSRATPPGPQPEVIFISGAMDRSDSRIVSDYARLSFFRDNPSFAPHTQTRSWDEADSILAFIRAQPAGTPIRLVGHSYGGDTAAQIAAKLGEEGRPVDLLITIDPVGRFTGFNPGRKPFFERVRDGSRRWINVNAGGGSSLDLSNIVAGLGSSWYFGPMGYADEFVNADAVHADFRKMMGTLLATGSNPLQELTRR